MNRPFIGPAGQFLRATLVEFGANPDEIRITNTVKFFPGRTKRGRIRPPTRSQVRVALPELEDEIRQVKPGYVLALGGVAIRTLTGYRRVEDARGQGWLPLLQNFGHEAQVLPTFHPSYIRGFGRAREAVWCSDIERFVADGCEQLARP